MKNTFVNIAGKLPGALVELYGDISAISKELDIDVLVVGAMARDLVLAHGYGSVIERGTRDADFGINVSSWSNFERLKNGLITAGFIPNKTRVHKLIRSGSDGLPWEIDIVPFGAIADSNNSISWPPKGEFAMRVLGFAEAFRYSLKVQVRDNPDITLSVASPAGVCLLKLVSWLDREKEYRPKDATDFGYLVRNYTNIPEIFDAAYEEGYMEAQGWDESKASAMKLGHDVGAIALPATTDFLKKELLSMPTRKEQFARDMQGQNRKTLSLCAQLFEVFSEAFLAISDAQPQRQESGVRGEWNW